MALQIHHPRFRSPQLAMALDIVTKGARVLPPGTFCAEEKFDGYRLIVDRSDPDIVPDLLCWTRNGKERMDLLSSQLQVSIRELPRCIFDGELVFPGGHSTDVALLSNRNRLQYVVFDILEGNGIDSTKMPYHERREILEDMWIAYELDRLAPLVRLAETWEVRTYDDVERIVDEVWQRGGEGIILKDVNATYKVGKRTRTFLKVKQCQPAVLRIIGFAPSEGEVNNYGAFGTAVLQDEKGVIVPVKVLDDDVRKRLGAEDHQAVQWKEVRLLSGVKVRMDVGHPWVGRKLHIEYQERTTDGSYRHPRWDRLDGE